MKNPLMHGRAVRRLHPAPLALAAALALTLPVLAQVPAADAKAATLAIGAQPLGSALNELSAATGTPIAFSPALVAGRTAPAVKGHLTVRQALDQLLSGSGLVGVLEGGSVVVKQAPPPVAESADTVLPAVRVSASVVRSGTTEGTGSYTPVRSDSANKLNLKPREIPQSITVVTRQMIEDKGLTTVEQVLQHTPGVSMVGDASQNSQIFVRGFYLESGILIDGLNTTSAQPVYEGSISQGLDPAIADRVEVVKGATGIVAGLGSPAASVNFVRKRPTTEFQAHADVAAGSWNRRSGEADISGPLNADATVRGRLVTALRKGDSSIDRYSYEKAVVYGVVDVDLSPSTTVSLAIDHQRSDTDGAYNWNSSPAFYLDGGVFKPSASFSTGQKWTYWDVRQTSVTPMLEHRFDNGWQAKLSLRRAEASIDRVSFYPGDSVDRATGNLVGAWNDPYADRSRRHSDTDSIDAYATGRFELFRRKHDLAFGVSQGRNRFSMATYNSGTLADYAIGSGAIPEPAISSNATYEQRFTQTQSGVFGTARLNPFDALKIMVGGRLSNWKHTTDDLINGTSSTVQHNKIVTPYVGLVYEFVPGFSAYASRTGVFRPVTNYGADGKLLEPAKGSNKEIGLKMGFLEDRLNLSLAAYETREDNFPEWANMGMLPSGEWIYRSIDGVKTTGHEIELSGRLAQGWDVSGGYTHNEAKDADGEPKLTYVPKDLVKFTLSRKLDSGFTLGGTVRWQSRSYYDTSVRESGSSNPAISVRQDQKAYSLLDLMARWQIDAQYAVTLNVNNVLNKTYYRSTWGYADYGESRNAMLALRAKW